VLEVLEKYHRSDGMKWNAMALRKAVTTLKKLPYSITSAEQALKIKGTCFPPPRPFGNPVAYSLPFTLSLFSYIKIKYIRNR